MTCYSDTYGDYGSYHSTTHYYSDGDCYTDSYSDSYSYTTPASPPLTGPCEMGPNLYVVGTCPHD